uniref:Uncharacterized protein n=1 Tax=viral metagenome TaxID=1070528 RepID=A0A6M3LE94_9ZZZZ
MLKEKIMRTINLTIDEGLRPIKMTCARCGVEMTVYPCPIPKGTGVCPNCSPSWLESFAIFLMNQERQKRNLEVI